MSPIGHIAAAFPAKRFAPKMPLILLIVASYHLDLVYMAFAAAGLETETFAPWSHSLVMAIAWALVAGLAAGTISRNLRNGFVFGLVVWSHWLFDFVVWDNLPLFTDSSVKLGLGVWVAFGFNPAAAGLNAPTLLAMTTDVFTLFAGIAIYMVIGFRQKKAGVFPHKPTEAL